MTAMIPTAQAFYRQLAQNNNRDWWTAQRGPYDEVLKPQALALLDTLQPDLAALTGETVTTKLFRPHRDVRFSKDKTPYKPHLHMMWVVNAGARQNPVFYFGIGVDYVTAGAGMMGFDKPVLADWRTFVDLDTKRVTGIIGDLEDQGFALREPALKRVPPAFDKDHPAGHLLRMKGVVMHRQVGAVADLGPAFAALWDLNRLLLQVAEA